MDPNYSPKNQNQTYNNNNNDDDDNNNFKELYSNPIGMTSPVEGWPQLNLAQFQPPARGTVCYICNGAATDHDMSFFKPCACPYVHRKCFHEQRAKTITPKNYFYCSTCDHQYKIERVDNNFDPASQEETAIRSEVRMRLILFWVVLILVLCGLVAFFGFIAYASESNSRDIPVAMTYVVTSVVNGVPDSNTTKVWREDFLNENRAVFPYYMIFGILVTSVTIIILFVANYCYEQCGEEENETAKSGYRDSEAQRCSNQLHCYGNDCDHCFYCWWCCPSTPHSDPCLHCNPQWCDAACDACCCHCDRYDLCYSSTGAGGGGSCDGCFGDCDCLGECGESVCGSCPKCEGGCECGEGAIPILMVGVLIVAIAVVLSAVFIVGYFASQRIERYHAHLSDALYKRSLELNNKMVVLGRGESLRPDNQV